MKSKIIVINEDPLLATILTALINNMLLEKSFKNVELVHAAGDLTMVTSTEIPGADQAIRRVMQASQDKTIYIQPAGEIPYTGSIYLKRKFDNTKGTGEHTTHTRYKWRRAVGNHSTLLGYWEWVDRCINRQPTDAGQKDEF